MAATSPVANRYRMPSPRGDVDGGSTDYTVAWRCPDGPVAHGSLRVSRLGLVLRGAAVDGSVMRQRLPLDQVRSVQIGRGAAERIEGERSVVLTLGNGETLAVAPLGAGEVFELAELVAELTATESLDTERVAVVLPLKRGYAERARELVADGPPFDLESTGLDRHHVFVTEREAVFLFEGVAARTSLERLVRSPRTLVAAGRWRDCVAAAPRIAEESYAWRREA